MESGPSKVLAYWGVFYCSGESKSLVSWVIWQGKDISQSRRETSNQAMALTKRIRSDL